MELRVQFGYSWERHFTLSLAEGSPEWRVVAGIQSAERQSGDWRSRADPRAKTG